MNQRQLSELGMRAYRELVFERFSLWRAIRSRFPDPPNDGRDVAIDLMMEWDE